MMLSVNISFHIEEFFGVGCYVTWREGEIGCSMFLRDIGGS
jgi:hypothetical protein